MTDPAIKRQALGLLKSKPTRTYREVAEIVGVSLPTVFQWAKKAKVHKPDARRQGVRAERNAETTLVRRKQSMAEIAAKFGG